MSKIMIAALVAGGLVAVPAMANVHPPKPRISMAQARAKALKLAPGKTISSEYEKEGGIWRYSFDIQQRGNVQEIGIDGRTGRIVENKSEGKKDSDYAEECRERFAAPGTFRNQASKKAGAKHNDRT